MKKKRRKSAGKVYADDLGKDLDVYTKKGETAGKAKSRVKETHMANKRSNGGPRTKVGKAAAKVETGARGVRKVATGVEKAAKWVKETANDQHSVTPTTSDPRTSIRKARDSRLPDLPCNIHVLTEAIDYEGSWIYLQPIGLHLNGFETSAGTSPSNTTSMARDYFNKKIWSSYYQTVNQYVRKSIATSWAIANFQTYFTYLGYALNVYNYYAHQLSFAGDSFESESESIFSRARAVYGTETRRAMEDLHHALNLLCIPPRLAGITQWFFQLLQIGETPMTSILQFLPSEYSISADESDANVAAAIQQVAALCFTDTILEMSGDLRKFVDSWRGNIQHWTQYPKNAVSDLNLAAVWMNVGEANSAFTSPWYPDATDNVDLELLNDNPNVVVPAMATIGEDNGSSEGTNPLWQPGLVVPENNNTANNQPRSIGSDGAYDVLADSATGKHHIRARRPIFFNSESDTNKNYKYYLQDTQITVNSDKYELEPYVQVFMKWMYHLDEMQKKMESSYGKATVMAKA